ncbi:MAG: WYL domain-containing protein [Myxococcales bacterium]|nr:WYL domain-containing protein [Myxococcales bacterium]
MADTVHRVLTLLALLHERRFWRGDELADTLGVTTRCVRRDVQRLRDLGYPVHASSGPGGGYTLGAGAHLPPLPLDDDEALAVAVGLRAAATGPVEVRASAVRAIAKLEAVLPAGVRSRLGALESVSVELRGAQQAIDGDVLAALARACRDEVTARFAYVAADGRRSQRRLEPYRLVHTHTRWFLLAWDLVRADWRTFRLDRIEGRVQRGPRFTPRELPDPDVARYVSERLGARVYRYQARMRVAAPTGVVRAEIGAYGWVEPAEPGFCWLETGADDLDAMARWLAFLDWELDRVEPAGLREAFARLAGRLEAASATP